MGREDPASRFAGALLLASIAVIIGALYLAREVLIPLALAVLLSFLLGPVVAWLQRWRLGRVPSVIVVVLLAFSLIGGIGWVVAGQLLDLAERLPAYRGNIQKRIDTLGGAPRAVLGRAIENVTELSSAMGATLDCCRTW